MKTLLLILIVIEGINIILKPISWWLERQNKKLDIENKILDKEIYELKKRKGDIYAN